MSAKGMLKTVIRTEMLRLGSLNDKQLFYLNRAMETMYEEGAKDGEIENLTCLCIGPQECPVCLGQI